MTVVWGQCEDTSVLFFLVDLTMLLVNLLIVNEVKCKKQMRCVCWCFHYDKCVVYSLHNPIRKQHSCFVQSWPHTNEENRALSFCVVTTPLCLTIQKRRGGTFAHVLLKLHQGRFCFPARCCHVDKAKGCGERSGARVIWDLFDPKPRKQMQRLLMQTAASSFSLHKSHSLMDAAD